MDGYDLSLAIQAIRVLRFESHTYQDCNRLVWKPTQFWLKQLTDGKPKEITCLHGPPYKRKKLEGIASNVFLVGPENKILYLGTVIDRERAEADFKLFPEIFESFPEKVEEIKQRGPMTIVRWWIMCSIPVDSVGLTQESIERGLQKYLKRFVPGLSKVAATWLPQNQQKEIDAEIFRQAESTAIFQTQDERKEIFRSDFFES